jgi:hypothetical protein
MSEEQEKDSKVQELKDQILKDKAPAASISSSSFISTWLVGNREKKSATTCFAPGMYSMVQL